MCAPSHPVAPLRENALLLQSEAEAQPIRQARLGCCDPLTDGQQIPVELAIITRLHLHI
jgi:hypothetical protein